MKTYKTEINRQVNLDELVPDNPVVPEDPAEIETDWDLMQTELGSGSKRKQKRGGLAAGKKAVVRRLEIYKYTGAINNTYSIGEVLIAKLFVAGVLPGIGLMAIFSGYLVIWALRNPGQIPAADAATSLGEKIRITLIATGFQTNPQTGEMMRPSEAPSRRAAVTNSSVRRLRKRPRTTRASCAHPVSDRISVIMK
jgi:hypothetical protein